MADKIGIDDPRGDEVFAEALENIIVDPKLRERFFASPADTLESLGVRVDDKERARLIAEGLKASPTDVNIDRIPTTRPLVKVATHGTQPVVSVAISVGVKAQVKSDFDMLAKNKTKNK